MIPAVVVAEFVAAAPGVVVRSAFVPVILAAGAVVVFVPTPSAAGAVAIPLLCVFAGNLMCSA